MGDIPFWVHDISYLFIAVLGWLSKQLWDAVKDLTKDLGKLREDLPKSYILKDDFKSFKDELFSALRRIEDSLKDKVDK